MNEATALRAWVEELILDKNARLKEIENLREQINVARDLEVSACRSMNETGVKLRNLEHWNGSMAKRIRAAQAKLRGLLAGETWNADSLVAFDEVSKILDTPAEELPF